MTSPTLALSTRRTGEDARAYIVKSQADAKLSFCERGEGFAEELIEAR
jgi:hypothetical protein